MKEKNGEHPFGDTGQLIFLGLFLAVWTGDSFFLGKSTFLAIYVPLYIRLGLLVILLGAAGLLFKSGHVAISNRDRPNDVISTGAFQYVRHPLYLGCILFYLGLTVFTASLFSFVLLVLIWVFYNYLADYEERLMTLRFGERYEAYKRTTGKWVPRIGRRSKKTTRMSI